MRGRMRGRGGRSPRRGRERRKKRKDLARVGLSSEEELVDEEGGEVGVEGLKEVEEVLADLLLSGDELLGVGVAGADGLIDEEHVGVHVPTGRRVRMRMRMSTTRRRRRGRERG